MGSSLLQRTLNLKMERCVRIPRRGQRDPYCVGPRPFTPDETMPTKSHNERRALSSELLGLYRKHGDDFARIEDLKRALREIATDDGENFKEEFAGEGVVKVSGAKEGKFKGIMPEVDAEKFLALSERRRETLVEQGIVKMNSVYAKPYYGSVTVDVF